MIDLLIKPFRYKVKSTMVSSVMKRVGTFAIYSRLMVFVMQVFFNYLIKDHEPKVFNPPSIHRETKFDKIVEFFFDGFRRWDGIYFTHIAEHGYTYENTLAFFPLYPWTVRVLANTVFFPLQYCMHYLNVLTVTGFILNFVVFIQAAKVLYQLSYRVLDDEVLAFKSAQLFCINPASIFFSAAYSETIYCYLALKGMLKIQEDCEISGSVLFGLSGLARSNGIVNCGFVLYRKLIGFVKSLSALQKQRDDINNLGTLCAGIFTICWFTLGGVMACALICILPLTLYQIYAYTIFCNPSASYKDMESHILNYGNSLAYKMPHTGLSKWCHSTLPLSYTYVQSNHWDVGFMKYYEYKQIPNFCLATPMILLCVCSAAFYIYNNFSYFMTLGLYDPSNAEYKKTDEEKQEDVTHKTGICSKKCFVYVVHMMVLLFVGVFFMHIQVVTRFIGSSSPVVYWYIATITTPKDQLKPQTTNQFDIFQSAAPNKNGMTVGPAVTTSSQSSHEGISDDMIDWDYGMLNKLIFVYFHMYFFVGIAAFSNFLPWT